MNSKLENEILTLYFEGELNSANAEMIEKDAENIVTKAKFNELLLDFSKLKYISSAGLRIILKLKQTYNNVKVVEASLEVYDILSMTGFVNIMEVKKALRVVDVTGAKVIGTGFYSTVYRINKDTIIKVFNRVRDESQIERELKLSKKAFVLGIPTAISFDIVRVEDKLGVCFEMLDCISLKDAFLEQSNHYDELIDKYVSLLKKINTTDCMDYSLPSMKDQYMEKVEVCKQYLEEKYYLKAKKLLETIPDSMMFVHGDCHFKNIMVQGDDLLLIDMDTLSRGHFIFELAQICAPYVAFEESDPGNSEKFLGVKKEFVQKIYYDVVERYMNSKDQAIKDKIQLVCYIHMIWWNHVNTPDNKVRLEVARDGLMKLLDKYNDLNLG